MAVMSPSEKNQLTDSGKSEERPRAKARFISVEIPVLLSLAVQGVLVNLRTQYIDHRLSLQYNYTEPGESNCTNTNKTGDPLGERIEAETALWVMYMKATSVAIPLFTALILVTMSDFVGRKPILIINATGHLLASIVFLLLAWLSLPLIAAVGAECILGICGDSVVAMNVAMAYIADISTGKTRTARLVLVSFLFYTGFGSSQILVDILLQYTENYVLAFGCGCVMALGYLLYTIIPGILLETVPNRTEFKVTQIVGNLYASFKRLFSISSQRRGWRIALICAITFFLILINEGVYAVITIYGLGPPFCWPPTMVGIYNVIVNVFPALVAAIAVKPLMFCISEYWIMQLGSLSGAGLLVTTAMAQTSDVLVYGAVAVGFLRTFPRSLSKALLSKLVSDEEQGAAFAFLSVISSLAKAASPFLLNAVYAKTVVTEQPQLTFFMASAIYIIPMGLTCILQVCSRPYGTETLLVQAEDDGAGDEEPLMKEE